MSTRIIRQPPGSPFFCLLCQNQCKKLPLMILGKVRIFRTGYWLDFTRYMHMRIMQSQVFWSGNLLLHQLSNSNYCVSLRQLAVPWPLLSGQQPALEKLAAPGGYFYSGCCPDHNSQGNSQLGRNYWRLVDIFIIKYIQV